MDKSIDIATIYARCESARPGTWRVTNDNDGMEQCYYPFWVINDADALDDADWFAELHVGDFETANFIAHARTDLPMTVEEIIYLRAENERLTRERDAAVTDISKLLQKCNCEHRHEFCIGQLNECSGNWPGNCNEAKWRGLGESE